MLQIQLSLKMLFQMLFYIIYDSEGGQFEYTQRKANSLGYTVNVACVIESYVANKKLMSRIYLIIKCIRMSLILFNCVFLSRRILVSSHFIIPHKYIQASLTKWFSIRLSNK